jgi:hypothetical protein
MAVRLADRFTRDEISQMHREMRDGASIEEVAARHGIPQSAVEQFRRKREETKRIWGTSWSKADLDYVFENYQSHDRNWSGWQRLGRSWRAICFQAGKLGLRRQYRGAWDEDELDFLRANYHVHPICWEGWKTLSRSKSAIISMARQQGLSRPLDAWTEEEKQFVRENYPNHGESWDGWKWLDRTWRAISNIASKMGVKRDRQGVNV